MKQLKIIFLFFLFTSQAVHSQQYSFNYINTEDNFSVTNDGSQVYCLFRSKQTKTHTYYSKVFLSENLQPIDSIIYEIEGTSIFITSGSNELYTYHVFETKSNGISFFDFLIADKSGKLQFTYRKTSLDFKSYFGKEIKIKNIGLNFLSDQHPELLLMDVFVPGGSYSPRLVAWSIQDGSPLWSINISPFDHVQITDSLIIGVNRLVTNSQASHVIQFINKWTGEMKKTVLYNSGRNLRNVAVVVSNGSQLMIAGDESQGQKLKNSHFFMTMFDMRGNRLFDKVDTIDRMGKYRRHLMGSVFDKDGNLILIGEGYKLDATKVIATTAASIAVGVLLGGGYVPGLGGNVENKIDFVTSVVLSTYNGEVKQYRTFAVGPWHDFATFLTDGQHVLIGVSKKFLLYDVDTPEIPPTQFATLKSRDKLILTSFGPAIIYRDASKRRIVIEIVKRDK